MTAIDVLADAFERIRDSVHPAVNGLGREELSFRPDGESNSIAWLVWHLTRIQDDHIAGVAGSQQVWLGEGWVDRFGLSLDAGDTGYGHGPDDVDKVTAEASMLLGYFEAVHSRTVDYLQTLTEADLPRIVDTHWDPPVTLAVRLVSVVADDLQHAGQAAYLRGLVERGSLN